MKFEFNGLLFIYIMLAIFVIIFAILKIAIIIDADIPEWVKWLLIFGK